MEEKFACISEFWMMSEYDERVKYYWKTSQRNYFVKMIDDAGLEDGIEKLKTLPLHVGAFVLSNSKRKENSFIHAIKGVQTKDLYYTYADSLYIGKKRLG